VDVYFAFSDGCGEYRRRGGQPSGDAQLYYIRVVLIIDAQSHARLCEGLFHLKEEFGLPAEREIRWNWICRIHGFHVWGYKIPLDKPFSFLAHSTYDDLVLFVDRALGLLGRVPYTRVLATVTPTP
jgi:hypothetical protein